MPQSGTCVSVEAVDPVFQVCLIPTNLDFHRVYWAGEDAGHAEADRPAGDGGRLVPLPPRLRLLALRGRHQHAAELRGPLGQVPV